MQSHMANQPGGRHTIHRPILTRKRPSPNSFMNRAILFIVATTALHLAGAFHGNAQAMTVADEVRVFYRPFGANYHVAIGPLDLIARANGENSICSVRFRDDIFLIKLSEAIKFEEQRISSPHVDTRKEDRSSDVVFVFLIGHEKQAILTISPDQRIEWVNYSGPPPSDEVVNTLLEFLPARDLRKFLETHKRIAAQYEKREK
jgi:hypothetical protein